MPRHLAQGIAQRAEQRRAVGQLARPSGRGHDQQRPASVHADDLVEPARHAGKKRVPSPFAHLNFDMGDNVKKILTRKIAAFAKQSDAFHMHDGSDEAWESILNAQAPPAAWMAVAGFGLNDDMRAVLKSMLDSPEVYHVKTANVVLFTMNGCAILSLLNTATFQKPEDCHYKLAQNMLPFCCGESLIVDIADIRAEQAAEKAGPEPMSRLTKLLHSVSIALMVSIASLFVMSYFNTFE